MSRRIEIKEFDWLGLTAFTLVAGFLVIIAICATRGDVSTMATVSSILGPLVGAVITFFFGVRKLDKIIKEVKALVKK